MWLTSTQSHQTERRTFILWSYVFNFDWAICPSASQSTFNIFMKYLYLITSHQSVHKGWDEFTRMTEKSRYPLVIYSWHQTNHEGDSFSEFRDLYNLLKVWVNGCMACQVFDWNSMIFFQVLPNEDCHRTQLDIPFSHYFVAKISTSDKASSADSFIQANTMEEALLGSYAVASIFAQRCPFGFPHILVSSKLNWMNSTSTVMGMSDSTCADEIFFEKVVMDLTEHEIPWYLYWGRHFLLNDT